MEPRPTFGEFTTELGLGWALVFSVASIVFVVVSVLPQIPLMWVRVVAVLLSVGTLWVAAWIAWKRERIARRVAERKLASGFEFDTTHEHALLDEVDDNGFHYQHQRVAVKNVGGVEGVPQAIVKLATIAPCPVSLKGRLPDVLQPVLVFGEHRSDPFPMHSGDPVLINVFTYVLDSFGENGYFNLWTTNPYVDRRLPAADYEIELIASGSPAQVERRRFKIGVANDRPFIRMM